MKEQDIHVIVIHPGMASDDDLQQFMDELTNLLDMLGVPRDNYKFQIWREIKSEEESHEGH